MPSDHNQYKESKGNSKVFETSERMSKICCSDAFSQFLRIRFTSEEIEQRDKSRKIDKYLEKDKHGFRRQVIFAKLSFLQ